MNRGKLVRLIAGVGLTVLFVWLVTRQTSLQALRDAFAGTSAIHVAGGLLAFLVGYACRIERWRQMLRRDNPALRWTGCAGPLLASFAANNVLPFRAGDLLRTFAFNRQLGVSSGVVIATLFVERLLDLLMVVLLLGAALTLLGLDSTRFTGLASGALVAAAAAISLVLLFPRLFAPLALAAGGLLARLAPGPGGKLQEGVRKALETLFHLAQGGTMLRLIAWSVCAWLAEGCVFWLAALALPSIQAPLAGWIALPVGTLATLIPSTPGYVGTFDFFTVRAMTEMGNTQVAATAYALLVHTLLWLPPTVIGGLYLLLRPVTHQIPAASH